MRKQIITLTMCLALTASSALANEAKTLTPKKDSQTCVSDVKNQVESPQLKEKSP